MALSGAECSMAVMAAFLLSLVVILSNDPFSINIDILGFTQNCSFTVFALFFMTDTCPISPYPEWLGVVVKAEEYGSVRCRVLNGSKGSFPFVLGRYTIQRTLLY